MTVIEASGLLFTWFSNNDTLELEENFKDLVLISGNKKKDRAAIICALEEFEGSNMVKSQEVEGKRYWILRRSFNAYEQTVEVNADLASGISMALNEFCEAIEDKTDYCDPSNLTSKDIHNLLLIYRHVQNKFVDNIKE